jgi:uncharacterized protein YbjT (DUF2867 family)
MKKVLITGATGNVGESVIHHLAQKQSEIEIYAGVRNVDRAKRKFLAYPELKYKVFDFERPETWRKALEEVDTIFLVRPPHISSINKYFEPLIQIMKEESTNKVVLLSVQGAERSDVIPHRKIEKLILSGGFSYIFLRPSYFMQNLTTTLIDDIRKNRRIALPAGKAKFNWVDVDNLGEIAAILLDEFEQYQNKAFDITGYENRSFYKVADIMSDITENEIRFVNTNPVRFFIQKNKQNLPSGMILVMFLLHFLPRFQGEPKISDFYEQLTGKKPASLKDFLIRNRDLFTSM